jgi:hypothetical protein
VPAEARLVQTPVQTPESTRPWPTRGLTRGRMPFALLGFNLTLPSLNASSVLWRSAWAAFSALA